MVAYQDERQVDVLKLQNAARNSTEWFETHRALPRPRRRCSSPIRLLTRSQRVSHENLRLRDKAFLEGVERWFVPQAGGLAGERPAGRPCSRR